MAYRHAAGYRQHDQCDLVACADLVPENARAFAEEFDISPESVYEDYGEMLAAHDPDFVSVCTPVPTHADIVVDCIESGHVNAIHCEKPMADTWGDARRMAETADDYGVQLTFNHQRRFDPAWREAKRVLDDGGIGDLERVEVAPRNVLDHGTHLFDMCTFFTDARPVDWVLGQVDYRTENVRYGTHNVNQAVIQWAYEPEENAGVGTAADGENAADGRLGGFAAVGDGAWLVDASLRLCGSNGVVELHEGGEENRYRREGETEWTGIDIDADGDRVVDSIAHVVDSFAAGEEPETAASRALVATELIFAVYESVRQRGRIDLPLDAEDNPLEALVDAEELSPTPAED
ncbi:gfo/Idh/MocA family oxidoreductase [Halomarina oriensis]|uniref:Gfo/Idh/MocA family oxidoreductase n=2 Tax=Halomarina oriensis TaxID=671145 RepID=A0A6B0GJ10_9EURY|nr:gfo/Idh/MocA family oxidoreductase [Halomarina oriensis]